MLKSKNNIVSLLFGVFTIINFGCYSQIKDSLIESVSINISFDSIQQILYVDFQNKGSKMLSLPWKESLPYSDFKEDIRFNVYVGNNRKVRLLKITKNIPIYVLEDNPIVLNKKGTITKKIELKSMISNCELSTYDYIYVQYLINNQSITSNRFFLKNRVSD